MLLLATPETGRKLRRDLPHNTVAVVVVYAAPGGATTGGGAIKIATCIQDNVGIWKSSISTAGKIMHRGIGPGSAGICQLENTAKPICAVAIGCAV